MRVLLIAGRSDRPEAHLIVGLQQAGFEVQVLCDTGGPYFPVLRAAGIAATHLTIGARLAPRAVLAIRRAVKTFQPDVVHAFTNRALACALPALRGSRARLVCYRGTTGHLSRWDPTSHMTYLNRRVDAIVCVSDAVRDYLLTVRVPPAKAVTIRKGHDVAWYAVGPPPAASELGVPEGAWVAGCVANMRRVKGAHVLLEAMRSIPRDRHLHAVFIGNVRDDEVRRLQRDPALEGRIHFTGFRSDATRLMARFSAVVMPSLEREGLPKAVVEAMAQGVPAVVSRVGGLPELVEDGVSGLVIPPAQSAPLADALLRLSGDEALRARMGVAARERIERVFNIRHTITQTIALYQRLLAAAAG